MKPSSSSSANLPPLGISADKVCYVIVKAREFDAKDVTTVSDPGSNAADDLMYAVLEDHLDDPVVDELVSFINNLGESEQNDLVALAWLGRGDGDIRDWSQLRHEARRVHNERTAEYLLGDPLVSDYLEEGLSMFGQSCADFERGHL